MYIKIIDPKSQLIRREFVNKHPTSHNYGNEASYLYQALKQVSTARGWSVVVTVIFPYGV